MGSDKSENLPTILSFQDIREYTDDFNPQNLIGEFQFGKVYHGKIFLEGSLVPKTVTVKVWEIPKNYEYFNKDNFNRLKDEILFLQQHGNSHPMLMKVEGFCCETDRCAIVYDFKSFDTLYNLITRDNFTWWQRMKVAHKFARFLRFIQGKYEKARPLIIRNIDAAHIMVDEDWNLKFYDFSMVTGGMFPNRHLYKLQYIRVNWGYVEPMNTWSEKSDVYGFGVVLLCLMTKKVYTEADRYNFEHDVPDRCRVMYMDGGENVETSLVHKSFEEHDDSFHSLDGPKITQLALKCVDLYPHERPEIDDVVNGLEQLKVARHHLNHFILQMVLRSRSLH